MVDHEQIFKKIKDILSRHATIKVDELDYGTHLTIEQTGIWIECEPHELTIGYGIAHRHYDPKHDDLRPALDRLINLLTKRKRITLYSKGDKVFKERTELQLNGDKFEQLGVAMTWMFPFWQRTTTAVTFEEPLIEYRKIENEIEDVYKLLRVDKAPSA
jgi:hypothetical protein